MAQQVGTWRWILARSLFSQVFPDQLKTRNEKGKKLIMIELIVP
jgi:hypothetical protein